MKPKWITHQSETHFYLPPHYGRGNHSDGWTPVCGAKIQLVPWREYSMTIGAQRCPQCESIVSGINFDMEKESA